MTADIWKLIHAERRALADDLSDLADEQWSVRSLCSEWTVLQVLGHLTSESKMTLTRFLVRIAGSGFRFDSMFNKEIAKETAAGPQRTLAEFRAHTTGMTSPPGPKETWLGEVVLHAEDIRRPLGIVHSYDIAALRRTADFYKDSNAVAGAKRRIKGLRLRSVDVDWSTGDGPEVTGPILSLTMAMTGRAVALDDLDGDGLGTLRARTT